MSERYSTDAPDAAYDGDPDDYYESFTVERRRRGGGSNRGSSGGGRRGGGRRRDRRGRGIGPALILLVVAALIVGGGYVGFTKLKDRFGPAPDYAGGGAGSVVFQVRSGDSISAMGQGLRAKGVVKSVDAFIDAAKKDERATGIQVGYYPMKKQMSAQSALDVLVNRKNLIQDVVLVREGARVRDIVKTIVAKTDFKKSAVVKALEDPSALGLPAAAKGNPEGYLFPATYLVTPGMTAASLLKEMVAKAVSVDQQLDLAAKAKAVHLSVKQVLTVASILQYEANRSVDYPKVARVIYNRLNDGMALQLDSTVSYVSGRSGDVWTTSAERNSDSLYNTYQHTGLPPGPIGSPGEETIKAALAPAKGNWLYFVPDFANGTTLFTDSYAQHQKNVAKAKAYCRTHSSC